MKLWVNLLIVILFQVDGWAESPARKMARANQFEGTIPRGPRKDSEVERQRRLQRRAARLKRYREINQARLERSGAGAVDEGVVTAIQQFMKTFRNQRELQRTIEQESRARQQADYDKFQKERAAKMNTQLEAIEKQQKLLQDQERDLLSQQDELLKERAEGRQDLKRVLESFGSRNPRQSSRGDVIRALERAGISRDTLGERSAGYRH